MRYPPRCSRYREAHDLPDAMFPMMNTVNMAHTYLSPRIDTKKAPSRGPSGSRPVPSTGQRRPALPRAPPAVPSARGVLASGFGTGPGVPPLPWPLTGGRRPPAIRVASRALGAAQRSGRGRRAGSHRSGAISARASAIWVKGRARAISTPRLSASPRLHLGPIDRVVYPGPYRKEN